MREADDHMALITPFRGEGDRAGDLLDEAERHYNDALKAFGQLKERLLDGAETSDAGRIARDYQAAIQTMFDALKRVEQLRKKEAGIAYDYAIDVAAARDEIGRRLERPRSAARQTPRRCSLVRRRDE